MALSSDGLRLSVLYVVAAKGEAWITLAVSKSGRTITGVNASPVAFAAIDAQSIASILANVLSGALTDTQDTILRKIAAGVGVVGGTQVRSGTTVVEDPHCHQVWRHHHAFGLVRSRNVPL
jgi:hypothetical protein